MNNFSDKFKLLENELIKEQRRFSVNSILKVFYSITINKKFRISFVSSIRPYDIESTNEIKVTQGKESDMVYRTCFDLINDDARDIFFIFCDSLIKSIDKKFDEGDALSSLKDRFYSWKLLFKTKGKMPFEVYQGLFGELYFLVTNFGEEDYLDNSIRCWVGPDGYSKDFSTRETWFEVKTIGTSSMTLHINSLAQLDSDIDGHLIVIMVEKMSDEFESGLCSVRSLYRYILNRIRNNQIKEEFVNKVLKYGFSDEDDSINNYKFEVKKVSSYLVNENFPKITLNDIKTGSIVNVTYDLLINSLNDYMEKTK